MRSFALLFFIVLSLVTSPSHAELSASVRKLHLDTDADGIPDEQDACPMVVGPADAHPKKNGCSPKALAKQWVVSFITKYAPPGRKTYYKHAEETKAEALVRYDAIADALVSVVYDPEVKPLFAGPHGRAQTASVILGVVLWETAFRKDVDFALGKHGRGDNGESWCLMQIKVGEGKTADWNIRLNRPAVKTDPPEDILSGYTGQQLVADRKLCIAEGLKIMRGSFGACKQLPVEERLSAYASGSCDKGREKSKQRVGTGMKWFQRSLPTRFFRDIDLLPKEEPVQVDLSKFAQG